MRGLRYISHCIYKGNTTILRSKFKIVLALFSLTNLNAFGVQIGVQRSQPLARVRAGVKPESAGELSEVHPQVFNLHPVTSP